MSVRNYSRHLCLKFWPQTCSAVLVSIQQKQDRTFSTRVDYVAFGNLEVSRQLHWIRNALSFYSNWPSGLDVWTKSANQYRERLSLAMSFDDCRKQVAAHSIASNSVPFSSSWRRKSAGSGSS